MWNIVVGFDWRARRLQIRSRAFGVYLDNLRVTVAPSAFYQRRAVASGQIDHRIRAAERGVLDHLCAGACGQIQDC